MLLLASDYERSREKRDHRDKQYGDSKPRKSPSVKDFRKTSKEYADPKPVGGQKSRFSTSSTSKDDNAKDTSDTQRGEDTTKDTVKDYKEIRDKKAKESEEIRERERERREKQKRVCVTIGESILYECFKKHVMRSCVRYDHAVVRVALIL